MAFRETVQIGHPTLKAENKVITDFNSGDLKRVIEDLTDTMREVGLIGMAAPQIGENYMLFITEPRVTPFRTADQADELRIYINPKIVKYSDEEVIIYEGCGSVAKAGIFGPVSKPKTITVEAYDENGRKFQLTADGILARVIQHEYDHLLGVTFIEKIEELGKILDVEFYKATIKGNGPQLSNSKITVKEFKYL
jgi:peptide deformylase